MNGSARRPVRAGPLRRLLLVGAGHGHLLLLKQAHRLQAAGIEITLLAPPVFAYSGLATGVLSGAVPATAHLLDVAGLAQRAGVVFTPDEAVRISPSDQTVETRAGRRLTYDALSLNLGSRVSDPFGLAEAEQVYPVKPLSNLALLRSGLEARSREGKGPPAIVVAGTGPGGFEVAGALEGLSRRLFGSSRITLVGPDPEAGFAPREWADHLCETFDRRGVRRLAGRVTACAPGVCTLADGRTLERDALVLATGLVGPDIVAGLGLPMGSSQRLLVGASLASIADDRVHAVGDCAVIDGHERPPLGVFGVRAAPCLVARCLFLAGAGRMRPYHPQSRYLSILDLGDGTALALYGARAGFGRAPLWLKRHLDRRFIATVRSFET